MGSYTSADVLCPYYEKDIPQTCSIVCEGILPGSRIKCYFQNRRAIQWHMGKYCAKDYRTCPWYVVMTDRYERED